MPFPFNRLPRGLLGLLDAKIGGQNPQQLDESVRSSVALDRFYEAQMREALTGTSLALVALGPVFWSTGSMAGVVPADEMWLIDQYSVQSQGMAAGEALAIVPLLRVNAPAGTYQDIFLDHPVVLTLALNEQAFSTAIRPFVALPGDSLGFQVWRRTAYAGTVSGIATVSRLKV